MMFDVKMEYGYLSNDLGTKTQSVFDYTFNNDGFSVNINNNDCLTLWMAIG